MGYEFKVGVTAELINEKEFRESLREIIRDEFKRVLGEEIAVVDTVELGTIGVPDYTEVLEKIVTQLSLLGIRV